MATKVGRRLVRSGSLSSESSDSEEAVGGRMRSIIVQAPRDLRTSPPSQSRSPSPPSRSPSPAIDHRRHRKRLPPRSATREREEGVWVEGDGAPPPKKKKEEIDPILTRTGGAYIPPARLRMMQQAVTDKSSVAYQRISWEALKKSINGLVNKVNVSNIANIVQELFQENVVRGRGLVAQSVIKAQGASPTFTHVYAGLVAIMNTKFPQTGELIAKRLLVRFRKGFRRNDKDMCNGAVKFIAHLVNQQVLHELVALELLTLLLEDPTDDSVEVAIGFLKECGLKLTEVSPRGVHAVFETLRSVLHSGKITARVQYMVEVMFAIRKDKFKEHPSVIPELDLVQEEDQITHLLSLSDDFDTEDLLNVFHPDPDFAANEEKYRTIKAEILGEEEEESGSEESGELSSSEESEDEEGEEEGPKEIDMTDMTDAKVLSIRRQIYLTIMSSLDYEECAHKLLKNLEEGQEREVAHMLVEVCSQERSYLRFYGLLGQRFCQLNQIWVEMFDTVFQEQYSTVHRLETNKLRNVAKFFAQLFYGDALPWTCMSCIHLNEEETNSSSRIFVKILFQELAEFMGIPKLNERLRDPLLSLSFEGLLPRDNPKNTRFAINFFTSIGLGGLTDDLREHLKNAQKLIMAQRQEVSSSDTESDSSDSSSEDSSDSSSSSTEESSNTSSSSSSEEEEHPRRHRTQRAQNDHVRGKDRRPKDKGMEGRWHQSKGRGERSRAMERDYDRKHEREEDAEERSGRSESGREGDNHRRDSGRGRGDEKRKGKDHNHRREVDEDQRERRKDKYRDDDERERRKDMEIDEDERERRRDKERRELGEDEREKRREKDHHRDKAEGRRERDKDEDERERSDHQRDRNEHERERRRDKDYHHQRDKGESERERDRNEDGRSGHWRAKNEDRMERRSERNEREDGGRERRSEREDGGRERRRERREREDGGRERRSEREDGGRERRRDRDEDSEGYDHRRYNDSGRRERDAYPRDQYHDGRRDKDRHSHEREGRMRTNH